MGQIPVMQAQIKNSFSISVSSKRVQRDIAPSPNGNPRKNPKLCAFRAPPKPNANLTRHSPTRRHADITSIWLRLCRAVDFVSFCADFPPPLSAAPYRAGATPWHSERDRIQGILRNRTGDPARASWSSFWLMVRQNRVRGGLSARWGKILISSLSNV